MVFSINHDLHIHSQLSSCSADPLQNTQAILDYAKQNNYDYLCLTDHYWDEKVPGASNWYMPQNTPHIEKALPLPQDEKVHFYFGCETDMDKYGTIGISPETIDKLDFVIIPTTHLHMNGFTIAEEDRTVEKRTELYVWRFNHLLDMDLPFHKIGVAHLTCPLMARDNPDDHIKVLNNIDDATFTELFEKASKKGIGIELNFNYPIASEEDRNATLRPYRIAKKCGCKFYFGSDAHHPDTLAGALNRFTAIRDDLGLEESDKFNPFN